MWQSWHCAWDGSASWACRCAWTWRHTCRRCSWTADCRTRSAGDAAAWTSARSSSHSRKHGHCRCAGLQPAEVSLWKLTCFIRLRWPPQDVLKVPPPQKTFEELRINFQTCFGHVVRVKIKYFLTYGQGFCPGPKTVILGLSSKILKRTPTAWPLILKIIKKKTCHTIKTFFWPSVSDWQPVICTKNCTSFKLLIGHGESKNLLSVSLFCLFNDLQNDEPRGSCKNLWT